MDNFEERESSKADSSERSENCQNLPVVHPSEYIDPLEASSRALAIGTVKSNGVLMAIGDESVEGEWIRMELDHFAFGEFRTER